MARVAAGVRCRCCPFGQHIDTAFVSFAEDVARGHSNKRTPTMPRRNLMSPMDSLFSDSMENIMSDFEEILANPEKEKKKTEGLTIQQRRLQNGYTSDYTGYRSNNGSVHVPSTTPTRTFALDYSGGIAPPKPVNRVPTNGRSTPSAYTALGRTIAEIKTRNADSPLPDRDRGVFSRTGTPIDLGLPQVNGNNGYHHPQQPVQNGHRREFEYREHTKELTRPDHLTLPRTTPFDPKSSDFASLRRGREVSVPEPEQSTRVRYFSASPKLPRRLQPAPPLQNPSNFTYSQQNGHTILSKSQGTCTDPLPDRRVITTTVGTSTGPLPPAKPCGECHGLRKELQEAIGRIPPPKPQSYSIGLGTDLEIRLPAETTDVSVGQSVETATAASATEKAVLEDRACSPIKWEATELGTQTDSVETAAVEIQVEKEVQEGSTQSEAAIFCHFGVNTDPIQMNKEVKAAESKETMTTPKYFRTIPSQTEEEEVQPPPPPPPAVTSSGPPSPSNDGPSCSDTASQTDGESCEPRVLEDSEIAESLWLMPGRETAEVAVGPDEIDLNGTGLSDCQQCVEKSSVFLRNVGVGACSITDKVCVSCDSCNDEVDENDVPGFQQPKRLDGHQVAAVKKLLTSEQKQPFVRGSAVTRSARIERQKSDEMAWVELKKAPSATPSAPPSQPSEDTADALKNKVVLKKEVPAPPSTVPDPVPARIPRPKISKYAPPEENAETPDEEDEASDRLTPLRSEMRTLGRWRGGPRGGRFDEEEEEDLSAEEEEEEGTYETHENGVPEGTPFEITGPLKEALVSLNSHLLQPGSVTIETADWALKYVQHEWHKTAARKNSQTNHVESLVEEMKQLGPTLLKTVVNMVDQNDNTALHYAVSHANFDVVSALLDSGECQLNLANKAGYTAVMLAALCSLEDGVERTVVQRLFEMGNVNARATQHGQTALMLAVSHGKKTAAELLLTCGADVNMQDEEGSTALMCAAEHGHRELVKLLLSCDGVDAAVTDCDSSTALSIAVENGHRDIGVLIYAHLNIVKERWSEPAESSTL